MYSDVFDVFDNVAIEEVGFMFEDKFEDIAFDYYDSSIDDNIVAEGGS